MAKVAKKKRGRPARPDALYKGIESDLHQRIESGEFPVGQALPSIRQLAKRYAVGEFTVRLAIDALKSRGMVETTPRKRLVVCKPDGAWTASRPLIAFVIAHHLHGYMGNPGQASLLRGLLREAGRTSSPFLTLHHPDLKDRIPPDVDHWACRGVVLLGGFPTVRLRQYEKLSLPVVAADRPAGTLKLHTVSVGNKEGAREATAKLISLGHRRIAFLRMLPMSMKEVDPDSRERQEGFMQTMREAGCKVGTGDVFNCLSGDKPSSPVIQSILNGAYTAVLAVSPGRARLVARAARDRGLTLGRELSLACFQEKEQLREPGFTGPRIDFGAMGSMAMRLALKPKKPYLHESIPTEWADGKTIGPCRSSR